MTEASKRYERGADPQQVIPSLERVCSLIQEVAGGTAAAGMIDRKARQFNPKTITCRLNRINQLLGTQLALSEVETILQRLQCRLTYEGQNVLHVQVPTYRCDLNSEVDLIEETARIYGYNHIPKPSAKYHSSKIPHAPIFLFEREIRSRLLGEGLQEFLTCDLINPVMMEKIKADHIQSQSIIQILNPNSVDQSILRPTLLPGLLELVKYNIDHKNENICGFEVGRIHFMQNDQCKEQSMAGIILSGFDQMPHWDSQPTEVDFYDLKGIVENLVNSLGITSLLLTSSHLKSFHPSRQGSLQIPSGIDRNQTEFFKAGILGEIHPAVLRAWGIPHRVFYAEINLHDLFQVQRSDHLVKDLPLFPSSDRDWTVTLPEELLIDEVFKAINSMNSLLLEKLSLLNIHRSEKIGPNVKNATFRLIYRSQAKTLSFDEVEAEHARIVNGTVKILRI
jgi:phenylalanyl-tRNA synthetase beta chain